MIDNKYCILLVEDDPDDRYFLECAFRDIQQEDVLKMFRSGMDFKSYMNNISADSLPDLIVFDVNLPGIKGQELLQMVKTSHNLAAIPVAMYSTGMNDHLQRTLTDGGADACFQKPFDYDGFTELARYFISFCEDTQSVVSS